MPDLFGPDAVTIVGVLLCASMAVILLTLSMRVFRQLRPAAVPIVIPMANPIATMVPRPSLRRRLLAMGCP